MMDLLPNDLYLPILALLHCFEDRWMLGMVNKQWRAAYRLLLKPYNDVRASEHMGPIIGHRDWNRGRHGPRGFRLDQQWYYDFMEGDYYMHCRFSLSSPVRIHVSKMDRFPFETFQVAQVLNEDGPCWKIFYPLYLETVDREVDEMILPVLDGDIFDQAGLAYRIVCDIRGGGGDPSSFNPVLARRIYNFPYFVRLRESTKT